MSGEETTWEVSLCNTEASRVVIATHVPTEQLSAHVAYALTCGPPFGWRVPAVMVTRTDSTPEARRMHWESEFYDVDKNGRRRRRYKRLQIEKDWEAMVKRDAQAARQARADSNIHQGKEMN